MKFFLALKNLSDQLGATIEAFNLCKESYAKDGIIQTELVAPMEQQKKDLGKFLDQVNDILAANTGKYEILGFLNKGLQMEYEHMINYKKYVSGLDDKSLKARLNQLASDEMEHIALITQRIREIGGQPHIGEIVFEREPEIPLITMLNKQLEYEKDSIKYYEQGMNKFDDPKFSWMVGQIKMAEEDHLKTIQKMIEDYQDRHVVIRVPEKFKWVDPHMGEPGDRSWIE
jgi:rubrerythrin